MTIDPIHQFQIHNIAPLFSIGRHQIYFTNSALFMLIIVLLVSTLLIVNTARANTRPTAVDGGNVL